MECYTHICEGDITCKTYHTLFSPTAADSPTNLNAVQIGSSSFRVFWSPPATVTGYHVYWSGDGGADSGNMSLRAGTWGTAVTITGLIPGLTYNITLVALSDHLPSPAVGVVMVTLGELSTGIGCISYTDTTVKPL